MIPTMIARETQKLIIMKEVCVYIVEPICLILYGVYTNFVHGIDRE